MKRTPKHNPESIFALAGGNYKAEGFPDLDLADQMDWEDNDAIQWVSLVEAGLEESACNPVFGLNEGHTAGIDDYVGWWLEEDSALQLH